MARVVLFPPFPAARTRLCAAGQHKEKGAIMLASILWVIIVLLVIFWLFGAFVANLGNIVWLALVIAVILLIYNLLTRGRAEI